MEMEMSFGADHKTATNQPTPGPWEAVAWNCHAATTIKAGDIVVAECSGFGRYADESIADARLIAAAPELLAALQEARDGLRWYQDSFPQATDGSDDEAMARIDAAITKATGSAA